VTSQSDRGSATIYVTAFVALLTMAGVAVAVVAAGFHAHRRAAAAADLAALAAAERVGFESSSACHVAAAIATTNGARLERCQLLGSSVIVSVAVTPANGWLPTIRVVARAGQGPEATG